MTIKRFRNFAKHGVSVILDLHQVGLVHGSILRMKFLPHLRWVFIKDVAANKFGTYDGFPPWLLNKLR